MTNKSFLINTHCYEGKANDTHCPRFFISLLPKIWYFNLLFVTFLYESTDFMTI